MDNQTETFGRKTWKRLTTPKAILSEAAILAVGLGGVWSQAAEEWAPRMETGPFLLWNLGICLALALLVYALGSSRR